MLKIKYDFIFITSCCDVSEIYNLIDSINSNNSKLRILLIITNMSCEILNLENISKFDYKLINVNKILNSSESRNLGIDFVLQKNLYSYYIAFPDDDTTYDKLFFDFFYNLIYTKANVFNNFICNVKCRENTNLYYRKKIANNPFKATKYDFDNVGAVNIILNFNTFYNNKYFNEKYGVGSIYGAGEDGDYFLRALNHSDFFYNPEFYTIHPTPNTLNKKLNYKDLNYRMIKYSRGVISVLCLHKMYLFAFYITLRAFGGFLINLKSNFRISILFFKIFFLRLYFLFKYSFYV
jgi:hypothetical protein